MFGIVGFFSFRSIQQAIENSSIRGYCLHYKGNTPCLSLTMRGLHKLKTFVPEKLDISILKCDTRAPMRAHQILKNCTITLMRYQPVQLNVYSARLEGFYECSAVHVSSILAGMVYPERILQISQANIPCSITQVADHSGSQREDTTNHHQLNLLEDTIQVPMFGTLRIKSKPRVVPVRLVEGHFDGNIHREANECPYHRDLLALAGPLDTLDSVHLIMSIIGCELFMLNPASRKVRKNRHLFPDSMFTQLFSWDEIFTFLSQSLVDHDSEEIATEGVINIKCLFNRTNALQCVLVVLDQYNVYNITPSTLTTMLVQYCIKRNDYNII